MKKQLFYTAYMLYTFSYYAHAQQILIKDSIVFKKEKNITFNYKQLILPVSLMAYGVIGIESDAIKTINSGIREEVVEDIDKKITIDDFSQYAPAFSVYALNNLGIKGKNNLRDRSIILATSYLLMTSIVLPLKSVSNIKRPDGSSDNSFPSGHTATAFAGAEFLWQEYKDVSIWYGISGYVVAAGTGAFRMYNNRHWLTDVTMGAGIGILSTKIAYWTFPYVNKLFQKRNSENSGMISPFYNGKQMGIGLILNTK
ncbi:phosphatase PAP2 family protein [Flavobacterium algicola]|uniref:phosphatase PAP2 family protein n=1 Tax=Flavobacterium algicola TaxID=556529 RepID=UPI001EFD7B01|nr:phosphatase PAP2 family protein [Flavobacterium algicola]MCG9792367.1 phosphatase PAP2 family protein [Flavobacterium algicola]